jgi:hypothetical protein
LPEGTVKALMGESESEIIDAEIVEDINETEEENE